MTKEEKKKVLEILNKLTPETRQNIREVVEGIEQHLAGYVHMTFYSDMSGIVHYEDDLNNWSNEEDDFILKGGEFKWD